MHRGGLLSPAEMGVVVALIAVLAADGGALWAAVLTAALLGLPWRRVRGLAPAARRSPAWGWYPFSAGIGLAVLAHDVLPSTGLEGLRLPIAVGAAVVIGIGVRDGLLRVDAHLSTWLDGLVVALAATYATWEWLWEPGAGVTATQALPAALVFGMTALALVLAAVSAMADRTARPALVAFAAACCLHLLALLADDPAVGGPGTVTSVAEATGWALFVVAAWRGQTTACALPQRRRASRPGGPWLPTAFALAVVAVDQVVTIVRDDRHEVLEVGLVTALLVLLTVRIVASIRSLQSAHDALSHLAATDPLTGLGNRSWITRELRRLLDDPGADLGALVLIDLDRFKVINDGLGHAVGDDVLQVVADRLSTAMRPAPVIRLGGDEFVVPVMAGDAGDPAAVAERARAIIARPVPSRSGSQRLTASIGVVTVTPGATPSELLRDADTAMYAAKDAGRDRVVVFDADLRRATVRRQAVESALRELPHADQLSLAYQPVLRTGTREVVAVEALLRWTHPVLGRVPTDELVHVAEDIGEIGRLGAWALGTALADLAVLDERSAHRRLGLHVNVSARQLLSPTFPARVRRLLDLQGIDPRRLTLELTETTLLEDAGATGDVLAQLRQLGCRLALDDFGTGYSAMSYLRDTPLQVVKIDRSFVADSTEPRGAGLLRSIVELVHRLGLEVIAEGVETDAQLALLAETGCDQVQGYLLGAPVALDALDLVSTAPA